MSFSSRPIGVFDSGAGGLTVFRALKEALPAQSFIYLGDTARLPYGTKTPETVLAYIRRAECFFEEQEARLLVLACNTATAHALPFLEKERDDVIGVIRPGALAGVRASRAQKIVVLATEGTLQSGAYQREIASLSPDAEVEVLPCGLLVALAEEGWTSGLEPEAIIRRYLSQIKMMDYDTVILGCTHFPILTPALRSCLPERVALVDSAQTTAAFVAERLGREGTLPKNVGSDRFFVTDGKERFCRLAAHFLGQDITKQTALVSL